MIMRIPTIAIMGLLVWMTSGWMTPVKATANSEPFSEPFTDFPDDSAEDSFVQPGFRNHPLSSIPLDEIQPEEFEALDINDLMVPVDSETPEVSMPQPEKRELFGQPFYPGEAVVENRERKLTRGASGSEVGAVQKRLAHHGFNPGPIDAVFGSRTTLAVRDFQRSVGLAVTGEVDQQTWEALAAGPQVQQAAEVPVLKVGSRGSKVKTLQARLQIQGFDPGPIDGIFGVRTTAAVKDFQFTLGLEPDGIVNEATWSSLSQVTPQ